MDTSLLSKKIFDIFVGNKNVYGVQDATGIYKTKYSIINIFTIKHMIENKRSLLTYQMVNSKQIKWNCLDFDIAKETLENDFKEKREFYFNELINIVRNACKLLKLHGINPLVEFSGNRGFHIWILFDSYISKKLGFLINESFQEKIEIAPSFNLDIFPTTSKLSKKGIGQGVKLPLSFHKKSLSYSYLIKDIDEFNFSDDIFIRNFNEQFITEQLMILEKFKLHPIDQIVETLSIDLNMVPMVEHHEQFIRTTKISMPVNENAILDSILAQLCNCSVIRNIISKYRLGLSEKERLIFVGLLNRITSDEIPDLGKILLNEFFSRMPNYREELTKKKLDQLKLQPISCFYLRSLKLNVECICEQKGILSPIEHLKDIRILPLDPFQVTQPEMEKIVRSAIKYTNQNDEVALFSIIKNLEHIDIRNISCLCEGALHEAKAIDDFYVFNRKEEMKDRKLVSLSADDKIVTKFFIKALHAYYYGGFSDNSYGYKFNYSFANDNIFYPWLQQWNIFIRHLKSIIYDEFTSDNYLIKLDIKSFYPSIDQQMLKIKLLDGPTAETRNKFQQLDETSLNKIQIMSETLIKFCEKTVGNSRGVPQGPAFARYLAEVYLMDFDGFIERSISGNLGLYFRYVDDIFIIVDSEDTARNILYEATVFLKSLNLEISNEKSFIGRIKDFRKHFSEYAVETKYFIDHTNLNIDPNIKVEKSVGELFKLLENGGKVRGNINTANLSFFLTHLRDHKLVRERIKMLEDLVLEYEFGRGSLYRNFFEYYFNEHYDDLLANSKITELYGIKRESFLNSLVRHYYGSEVPPAAIKNIKTLLLKFTSTFTTDVEKELITIIILSMNDLFDKAIFDTMEPKMITSVLKGKFVKVLPDQSLDSVFSWLYKIDYQDFIDIVFSIINTSIIDRLHYPTLGSIFFKKMLNYIGSTDIKDYDPVFVDNEVVNKYYYLCCILTLVVRSEDVDFESLMKIWTNLMYFCNKRNKVCPINIDQHMWLKKWECISLDGKIINLLLIKKLQDGLVKGFECKLGLFDNYCTDIITLLLLNENTEKRRIIIETKDALAKLINADTRTYLKWIINNSDFVEPFPNKEVCIKNLIYNDRLALCNKRSKEILVRLKDPGVINESFIKENSYQEEPDTDICSGIQYKSFILPFNTNEYMPITQLLNPNS
ncbi:MAG: TOTE conflict system archaeo-eukaryotic primase domain-containing protein [Syntrophales bacterium]